MDALMSWAKENYQFICFLVGLLGVVVAVISLWYEIKKKREEKKEKIKEKKNEVQKEIAMKEAELNALESSMQGFVNVSNIDNKFEKKLTLKAEIEELKKRL